MSGEILLDFNVLSAGVATFGRGTWSTLRLTFPVPETRTIGDTTANMAATIGVERDEAARSTSTNVLRRPLRVEETAATVAWVASDMASGVAGQVVNVCAGAIVSR
jgi:NAD(P)-dependent dehydrogenase (short-subunit alcohol dehydrogenase family)